MKKIVVTWVVCVLALVGLFAWLGGSVGDNRPSGQDTGPGIEAQFELLTAGNKTVRSEDLKGKYLLVYFGFTHCPDQCPTSLLLMSNVLQQIPDVAPSIQPIFISVDHERDTPEIAAQYAHNFSKTMLGLSGSAAQVKNAADSFKVYYTKVEDEGSALGYVVDHSGFIYLMGPDGKYITHFAPMTPEQELKKDLLRYVK